MKTLRKNGGFTLVELVVVMAIMAILAGVGTVGYGAYIKSANKGADKDLVGKYLQAIENGGYVYDFSDIEQLSTSGEGLEVPVGFVVLTDSPDDNGSYTHVIGVTENSEEKLNKLLKDTFGEKFESETYLVSDDWNATIPTFFTNVDKLFDSVDTLTGLLTDNRIQRLIDQAGYTTNSDYYGTDESKALAFVAQNITGKNAGLGIEIKGSGMTEDEFVQKWKAAATGDQNYAFGLNSAGMETYIAVRRAYNEGFASYVLADNSEHSTQAWESSGFHMKLNYITALASDHSNMISNCGLSVGNLCVSECFNSAFVANDACPDSYKFMMNTGYLDDEVQRCTTCRELYDKYITSPECEANARAFYQTMVSIVESIGTAREVSSDDIFKYYDDYIGMINNSYSKLQTLISGKSAVIITISQSEYSLNCDNADTVSPVEANPRID